MERSTKYPPDPSDPPEVKVQVTPPALTQFVDPQVSAFAAPAKQNATANIEATLEQATNLGAKIALPKTSVPGVGAFAAIIDPEGNICGLWEQIKS